MIISVILVIVLVYLTFSLGIAYWILTHSTKQETWLKILGLVMGIVIIILSTILMITTTYYGIKHRHDYYKQCPMYKMMQMHRQQGMPDNMMRSPCPLSNPNKTGK